MNVSLKDKDREMQNELKTGRVDPSYFEDLGNCILKYNEFCIHFSNDALYKILYFLDETETDKLSIIKTQKWSHLLLNKTITELLSLFDGERNLRSVFDIIKSQDLDFFMLGLKMHHFLLSLENISGDIEEKSISFELEGKFDNFIRLVKILFKHNIVEYSGYGEIVRYSEHKINNTGKVNLENKRQMGKELYLSEDSGASASRILLFGDTVGISSVGLLYLASYLRRNGVEAYCQWTDPWAGKQALKDNIERLLDKLKPDIVGVSLKWSLHMARAMEICKIVKDFSPSIKVVVGGDSATYYSDEIIQYEYVDYIIQGEGELPLLKLCRNSSYVPNCIYKENGRVVSNPLTCVQTEESSSDIYLSHLDRIFASPVDPYFASSFFILTSKGCSLNCCYCAGCLKMQKRNFGRHGSYPRDVEAIRNDIIEVKSISGTLMFEFEPPYFKNLENYVKMWEGIDLSNHYCWLYFWFLPSKELLELITKTFKYVCINLDLCSLSEPHRMKLTELKLARPQPKDRELFEFFERAEGYRNLEIRICLIAGLPYFEISDIEESNKTLGKLLSRYKRFSSLSWGRLHDQPGAPITCNSEGYGMRSTAASFEDFLHYSKMNFDSKTYPDQQNINYPVIYYKDQMLEDKVNEFYSDTQKKLLEHYFSQE